ncbi:carbonic anhydrase [Pseudobacillus sp. FSL P4-0506]|uniref:carbonic anhydrase n=1 Tax=unclassified Pseudobacillus TaxID=2619284 RepID=UPI0030F85F35
MNLDKNQKALFLTDMENELEPILQEVTNIRPENMLTIQCYGPVISNPYGDIMRSVIIAIYQENVEEIFVVGTKDRETASVNALTQLDSMKDKIQTLDYLFQNSRPEYPGGTVNEWLNGKENGSDNIENCVNTIHHHPLVPSYVKVRGLIVNTKDEKFSIAEVPINKTASTLT